MNAIPALLNDVLGGENMQFTDCSALFRRIEACRASYAQFPGGNGLPTCRHAYNTEEMREGSCSSDPENSGVLRDNAPRHHEVCATVHVELYALAREVNDMLAGCPAFWSSSDVPVLSRHVARN
ncbi:hypothetical protein FOMPIDRAFT_1024232, partial [Fomitopsis schrenkii]